MKTTAMASDAAAFLFQPMLPLSIATIDLFAPPLIDAVACALRVPALLPAAEPSHDADADADTGARAGHLHPRAAAAPPAVAALLSATELGGFLGSHAHTHPTAASPGALLLSGLCNDAALGQQEVVDDMSCSKLGLGGDGQ